MKNIDILEIVNSYSAARQTANETMKDGAKAFCGVKLPANVAWARRVNIDKLFAAKKLIDEALSENQRRYGTDVYSTESKNDAGETVRTIKPEYFQDFLKEQAEILEQETDIAIKKVKIEDLGNVELTDADMDTLLFMIEE